MPNLKRPPRVLMEEKRGNPCAVPGCRTTTHGSMSRFCRRHQGADGRYGSPTQTRILRKTTKPYERVVSELITTHRKHPALVMVFGELDELLAAAARARAGNPYTPGRMDWRGKMQ